MRRRFKLTHSLPKTYFWHFACFFKRERTGSKCPDTPADLNGRDVILKQHNVLEVLKHYVV